MTSVREPWLEPRRRSRQGGRKRRQKQKAHTMIDVKKIVVLVSGSMCRISGAWRASYILLLLIQSVSLLYLCRHTAPDRHKQTLGEMRTMYNPCLVCMKGNGQWVHAISWEYLMGLKCNDSYLQRRKVHDGTCVGWVLIAALIESAGY